MYLTMLAFCTVLPRRNNIMDIVRQYGSSSVEQNDYLLSRNNVSNSTDNQCQVCRIREDQKRLRIESIKNRISHALQLDVLGLPNVTRKIVPKIPSYERLRQQYELNLSGMQSDQPYSHAEEVEDEEEEFGRMERTFVFSENRKYYFYIQCDYKSVKLFLFVLRNKVCVYIILFTAPTSLGIQGPNAVYFNIPNMENRHVYQAHVWVYIAQRRVYNLPHNVSEMFLYKLVHPGKRSGSPVKMFMKKRKKSIPETSGWHKFDITDLANSWVSNPSSNLGIVLEAFDANNENLFVLSSGSTNSSGYVSLVSMHSIV